MKLLFDPIWAWPWVALAAAGSLVALVVAARGRLAGLAPGRRRLLVALRLVAWAILLGLFLQPALEFTRTDPNAAILLVVTDQSRSMQVRDASSGMSRREALLKALSDAQPEFERLARAIEIRHFDFAQDLAPVEQHALDPLGEQSAIGHVLDELVQAARGKRIIAALLFSDGAQRALPPLDVDPRAAATRLVDQQVRVDTIPFGETGLADNSLDLIAEDLQVSPTVFVKSQVIVSAKVRALGAADRELTVRLAIEDPASALPGQPPRMKPVDVKRITPTRSQELIPLELKFLAEDPGEFKLTLEVTPLEGEPLTANNSLTTFVSVLKGGISVAYFDQVRPEVRLKRIDESPDIRLDFKPIRLGAPGAATPLEDDWFLPGKYDVYLIGSVPARVFAPKQLESLARLIEQGAGLMMTGGTLSFGPGGYADTPLADPLPVEMLRTELQSGDEVDPTLHIDEPLHVAPTALGLQHFVMRLDAPEKNLDRWKTLPPLDGANRLRGLKDLAQVLAVSPENNAPLLVAMDYGRGRTLAFAADSTYHWFQFGREEDYQRFWQQAILWLAHKDQQGDESVWVKLDSRRFRVGQPVALTFGARDPEKQPMDDAEFRVEVLGPSPSGKPDATDARELKYTVTPQRSGTENTGRFQETSQPGEYRVRVEASRQGQSIGFPAEARFVVYEQDLELHNPAADLTLMEEIARITGGSTVLPEELAAHLRRLEQQGLNLEITEVRRVPLWDNWPVLLLFTLTLTAEWYLRKRRGLV